MFIEYSTWETFEYKLNSLHLDLNNPRIKYRDLALNQPQIIKFLIKNEKVYELAKKISEEGYFVGEEPIICIENGKKVVLEGNRRTAALKLLQDPKKYLSTAKSKVLLQNILKNNFPVDKKLKCYIAPNRLLANPLIYERHNGASLQRWKTGNQYAFVAEMYYEDGLSISDISEVLNEKRSNVVKPLKAYNLFYEGKEILEKEKDVYIDISEFDITNLERFYNYDPGRKLLGIEFSNDGELIINIPREEFEKRVLAVFELLIDAERFSRDFNNESDKKRFVDRLKDNRKFDFNVKTDNGETKSRTTDKKADLEKEKNKKTTRRKKRSKKSKYQTCIIPRDQEVVFDHEKLDSLFSELKGLSITNVYSFSLLLRTYLEQSLYFYLREKSLLDKVGEKVAEENEKNGLKKVESLTQHISGKYSVTETIATEPIMKILRFNGSKEYSNTSLKSMLDYVMKNVVVNNLDVQEYKNLKDYVERIKSGLDLAVHNIETIVDFNHNKRAWKHLSPLFEIMSEDLISE
ncbi:MAG: hypothetical protein WBL21_00195 [Salinimicrobium sp.]